MKKYTNSIFFYLLLWAFFGCSKNGQQTIVIDDIPSNTPKGSELYFCSNINEWNPKDPKYEFERNSNGKYYLTIEDFDRDVINYLITRGGLDSIQSAENGTPISVREFSSPNKNDTINIKVDGWSDLNKTHNPIGFLELKVLELPNNTPPESKIYVAGDFNGWIPKDERYKLQDNKNGSLKVTIPVYDGKTRYKYTRGNWLTSESKVFGRPKQNREISLEPEKTYKGDLIKYWSDQSFGLFNPYSLFLLISGCIGIFLFLTVISIKKLNKQANRYLTLLIALMSVSLLTKIAVYDRSVFYAFPRLEVLPDIIYFSYAPILYLYIKNLLFDKQVIYKFKKNIWIMFLPFILQIFYYIKFFVEPTHIFIGRGIIQYTHPTEYVIISFISLVFNIYFWFQCKRIVDNYIVAIQDSYSQDDNVTYLNTVLLIKKICLIIWGLLYIIGGFGLLIGMTTNSLTHLLIDIIWGIFALNTFVLGYFAILKPEILKMNEEVMPNTSSSINIDEYEINIIKQKLIDAMQNDKMFLNSELSLPILAENLGINLHVLSRVINEKFEKNFRDFVNDYRVKEFIIKVKNNSDVKLTYLGIAMDVGFNSKSSFNRSFKKSTNKTPREYFQTT